MSISIDLNVASHPRWRWLLIPGSSLQYGTKSRLGNLPRAALYKPDLGSVALFDNRLLARLVVLFLDHRRPVSRLPLFDDRGPVTIDSITIVVAMRLTSGHSRADGTDVDTDFVSEGRGSEGNNSGNSQSVFHYVSSMIDMVEIPHFAECSRSSCQPPALRTHRHATGS